MIIRKNAKNEGELIVSTTDRVGRADARLVTIISKSNRELKGKLNSLYNSEDTFKQRDGVVATFPWDGRDKVARVIRTNSFAVEIKE